MRCHYSLGCLSPNSDHLTWNAIRLTMPLGGPEGTVDFRFAFIQNKHSENLACPFDQNTHLLNSQDKHDTAFDLPAK